MAGTRTLSNPPCTRCGKEASGRRMTYPVGADFALICDRCWVEVIGRPIAVGILGPAVSMWGINAGRATA